MRRCAILSGLLDLNTAIDALDGKIAGATQLSLYLRTVQDMALLQLAWFMRNAQLASGSLAETIAVFKAGIGAIAANLDQCLRPVAVLARAARAEELVSAGNSKAAIAFNRRSSSFVERSLTSYWSHG